MSNAREVESAPLFYGDLARARVLHLAEGILMCLRGCTPEAALTEMVSVARAGCQSTFFVAAELLDVTTGAANTSVVEQYWNARLGRNPQ